MGADYIEVKSFGEVYPVWTASTGRLLIAHLSYCLRAEALFVTPGDLLNHAANLTQAAMVNIERN